MEPFDIWLRRWNLVPDGSPIVTRAGHLLPVKQDGTPAMLKLATEPEERRGAALLEWWDGLGAAMVMARDANAILMERAEGSRSLADMARTGSDDEACRILCDVAAKLHAPRDRPVPDLVDLSAWFRELWPAANRGGILARCADAARDLLADPRQVGPLHGDLHHGNVLDFGNRGWLAVDPKGLFGECGFDVANIFTNPDLADPVHPVAALPDRFARRLQVVGGAARLERTRLLQWILAWTGLSAAWSLGNGDTAAIVLCVAELAAAELDR